MTPKEILREAERQGAVQYYALVSGGKDSLAAAHVANEIVGLSGVLFIDTTIGLDDTREHVKALCASRGWTLEIIKSPGKSYEEFVMAYGFPQKGVHQMVMLELKWKAMYAWWKAQPDNQEIAFISGSRRKESVRRMRNAEPITVDKTTSTKQRRGMVFVAPLYDWSTAETWDFVRDQGLAVSPAYEKLHMSGDCLCGAYSARGEAELLAVFYPDMADRIARLEARRAERCPGCPYNTWGNQSSMTGAQEQTTIEGFICQECTL